MGKDKELEKFKQHFDEIVQGNVPINTAFAFKVAAALEKYKEDKGLMSVQDVVRLSCSNFLTKSGYLI